MKKNTHLHHRHKLQALFLALTNTHLQGFSQGTIYQGNLKQVCLPGLQCYSCPSAIGACPIGSLQNSLTSAEKSFPYYVTAFLLTFGLLFGRAVCAMLCPFGFLQDLLYKLRPKQWKTFALPKIFRKLPYVVLISLLVSPLLFTNSYGISSPAFCKWICPSGTFFGAIPLLSLNPDLRSLIGSLFYWKMTLLLLIILWSVVEYRPFCQYLCPLGAIYGLFQKCSLYQMSHHEDKCTHCQKCHKACPMSLQVTQEPNHPSCVRCGNCVTACPHEALDLSFSCGKTSCPNSATQNQ